MRNVKAAVRRVVGIFCGPGIAVNVVAVKVTGKNCLSVSAYGQMLGV